MFFTKYIPSQSLQHLTPYFWTLRSSHDEVGKAYRFVPDGYVDWVFHLGTPWQCEFPNSERATTSRAHLFGQIKRHVNLNLLEGPLDLFGVKFYPWVADKIWKTDMHYLTDSCLALSELGVKDIAVLEDRIQNASSTTERIEIMESYLTRFANVTDSLSLKPVLLDLEHNTGLDLHNSNLGIGVRRLEQRFKNEVGIPPKLFHRTQRINKAIGQMIEKPNKPLTQIAMDRNYFDQSHFIKDFKQFTGYTPSAFLKSINPNGDILNLQVS